MPVQNSAFENFNSQAAQGNAIAFIDSSVPDWQTLAAGVAPGTEVFILDATRDGVEQISQILQTRQNIAALHIISHGSPGNVQIGNGNLNSGNLDNYINSLQQWRNALADNADILIYGCKVGAEVPFLQRLAQLTSADIAASEDFTGSTALGGDWDLEFHTGLIEAPLAFQIQALEAYDSLLATYTYGGYTWDDANAVTNATANTTIATAAFATSFPEATKTIGNLLSGNSNYSVDLGDDTTREEIQLTWGGNVLTNDTGNDFVVYETGSSGAPEAFAVAVRKTGTSTFTTFRYEQADNFDTNAFSTAFDLSDFGLASGESINAIRITNLIDTDLVAGTDGQGNLGGANTPQTGPQGGGTFPAGRFDPDITYVVGLQTVAAVPTVSLTATDNAAAEGNVNTGTFRITRSSSTNPLAVQLSPATGIGIDYNLSVTSGGTIK